MEADLVRDLFVVSLTVNVSTAIFLLCRSAGNWAAGRYANQTVSEGKRMLVRLQEEKPWVLARFFVMSIQAAVLLVGTIHLLCEGAVLKAPFIGLSPSGRAWFAVNIGCYMYQLVQDSLLQTHLPDYNVTFMHHLLAAVLYLVYLENRQNALYGTLGLLFLVGAPFFEMRGLLMELGIETHRGAYGVSLLLSGLASAVFRLLLPAGFMIYGGTVASPFVMDIVVLSSLFFSLVFFGMLGGWFVISPALALRARRLDKSTRRTCSKPLRTGQPRVPDIKVHRPGACRLVRYMHRRQDLARLAPCSNTNLAPTKVTNTRQYHKVDFSAFLNAMEAAHHSTCRGPPPEYTPAVAAVQNEYTVQNETPVSSQSAPHPQAASSASVAAEGALLLSSSTLKGQP